MNNVFNLNRFGNLFKKHFTEHYKSYLMSSAVLWGFLCLFYMMLVSDLGYIPMNGRIRVFVVFFMLCGCVFTSTIFSSYSRKHTALADLLLPASHLEKFILAWIVSFVLYIAAYLMIFFSLDGLFLVLGKMPKGQDHILRIFSEDVPDSGMLYLYPLFHAFTIYGAIFFRKIHFIKTMCLFFGVIAALSIFHGFFLKSLADASTGFSPPLLSGLRIMSEGLVIHSVFLDQSVRSVYLSIVVFGTTLTLWTASFYTLKEKQL